MGVVHSRIRTALKDVKPRPPRQPVITHSAPGVRVTCRRPGPPAELPVSHREAFLGDDAADAGAPGVEPDWTAAATDVDWRTVEPAFPEPAAPGPAVPESIDERVAATRDAGMAWSALPTGADLHDAFGHESVTSVWAASRVHDFATGSWQQATSVLRLVSVEVADDAAYRVVVRQTTVAGAY